MFTGIIEYVGHVEEVRPASENSAQAARLCVNAGPLAASVAVSGSIAVNGCCLTVVATRGETFVADLSSETLRRTSFTEIKPGARVNLERPMNAAKEFGGHFVQGHVDGIGRVVRWDSDGANWWLGVRLPNEIVRYAAMKGSIAIDGISLTVANLSGDVVEAAIIPFTYANTNLEAVSLGDAVNIEADILAKYVERIFEARRPAAAPRLTVERLAEQGF
ncbi:MAG TPA: riboflavin synthase [Candidatus Acidoferrales bacterium]|jgi:riboflavin synthase|nr:riboflavin synthase [Candidatus Acidoferrales bacterium]